MSIADESRDYYHINRVVPWSSHDRLSVGDEVDIGGESNPFYRFFETQRRAYPVNVDGEVVQVPAMTFLTSVRNGSVSVPNLAPIAHEVAQHFLMYARELLWENIRRGEFPHLPSRQRCVWLILNEEGVKYWLQRMGVSQDFQVVRVRVQGRLHKASETYLLGDSEPMEETIQKARQYWLGVVEEAETEEIIFEGRMRIEEVMPRSFYE